MDCQICVGNSTVKSFFKSLFKGFCKRYLNKDLKYFNHDSVIMSHFSQFMALGL